MRRSIVIPLAAATLLLLGGCADVDVPRAEPEPGADSVAAEDQRSPVLPEQVFDREFLFVSSEADSSVHVPWLFRARSTSEGVLHERSAWIGRDDGWEELARESTGAPPSRTPWRLLPGERIRLVVEEGDHIDALYLRDPARALETRLDRFLTEWVRPGGESVRISRGHTDVPSGAVEGFVLERNRRWETPDGAPGDWIFLHAGDDLQLFLEETVPMNDPRLPAEYRAWSRFEAEDALWPRVQVEWVEVRAFERARRDIPAAWRFSSRDGAVSGELEIVSSQLEAREGEGPLLPVSGFFAVRGTVHLEGTELPVRGTVRHVQR